MKDAAMTAAIVVLAIVAHVGLMLLPGAHR
jgi:hypothetical protein